MSTVVGDTLPLAVAVAISPVPIIALVLILLSLRARSNGPAYLLGWLVGLAVLLSSAGNIALVLAAGAAIGRAKLSLEQEVGAGAIFVVLSSLLVHIVVIYHFLAHERATKMLQSWKVWLLANRATITEVAFLVIGTLLVGKGISGLGVFG